MPKLTRIKDLKKGEYFTLKVIPEPKENQVYIRDDYDRTERKYLAIKFSDISSSRLFSGDRLVYTEFTF